MRAIISSHSRRCCTAASSRRVMPQQIRRLCRRPSRRSCPACDTADGVRRSIEALRASGIAHLLSLLYHKRFLLADFNSNRQVNARPEASICIRRRRAVAVFSRAGSAVPRKAPRACVPKIETHACGFVVARGYCLRSAVSGSTVQASAPRSRRKFPPMRPTDLRFIAPVEHSAETSICPARHHVAHLAQAAARQVHRHAREHGPHALATTLRGVRRSLTGSVCGRSRTTTDAPCRRSAGMVSHCSSGMRQSI